MTMMVMNLVSERRASTAERSSLRRSDLLLGDELRGLDDREADDDETDALEHADHLAVKERGQHVPHRAEQRTIASSIRNPVATAK